MKNIVTWIGGLALLVLATACTDSGSGSYVPNATIDLSPQASPSVEVAQRDPNIDVGLSVGDYAPDIVGTDLDGNEFKLSDYRGKVVMLDFWGDW